MSRCRVDQGAEGGEGLVKDLGTSRLLALRSILPPPLLPNDWEGAQLGRTLFWIHRIFVRSVRVQQEGDKKAGTDASP